MRHEMVFVIGAPRSGTTWLRKLLSAHPSLVAPTETHLFSWFLGPMYARWDEQRARVAGSVARHREGQPLQEIVAGLPTVLTDDEFDELGAAYVDRVADRCLEAKPTASLVVEKTPQHVQHVPVIERVTGGTARYIHIVRHGYDVVDSLVAASQGWAARWAPGDRAEAAARWRDDVLAGRRAAALGDRYREVCFEHLLGDHSRVLADLFDFLEVEQRDIPADADGTVALGEVAGEFRDEVPEPPAFQRRHRKRDALTVYEAERQAGDLLDALGYERWSLGAARRAGLWSLSALRRLGGQARRRVRRVGGRLRGTGVAGLGRGASRAGGRA